MRNEQGTRAWGTVRLLGTVSARIDGEDGDAVLSGVRLRGLLARLALDAGRPVGVPTLVEDLWGAAPPEAAANALQSLVSRLRRALGPDRVTTASGGYRLDLDHDRVDALRFAALRTEAAAQADTRRAAELLEDALGLWPGGPALSDVRDLPFAGPAATRLTEARASAIEELAERGGGDPTIALDALSGLLAEQPLRESAAVALARSLTAGGRQADALAVLDRTRDALADELGVDPGPELARTRLAVLRGEDARSNGAPPPVPAQRPVRARRPPAALTSFVGREADVERLRRLLEGSRLVTVIGPGGAGKTRLALEAVADESDGRPPVAVVALAPLSGADDVVAAMLHAAGGPELVLATEAPAEPRERLNAALAGRDLLLVLDNCEHLIDAVASLVAELIETVPGLQVLATSREPLGITGEVLHPLGALPDADAVRLFVERAAAVRPGFDAVGADADAVATICRRLDGQPLPIELAAARIRTLSPSEIAGRLDDRFRLLTSGSRTALPRHQTLRAVVDWSWELLTPDERRLAARLGVFGGPVDADAIEAVCDDRMADVFDLLAALVDKSLVMTLPDPDGGPTRYLMLETIRDYAAARLAESGERDRLDVRHADWALRVAETAEPGLRGADQLVHLATIRRTDGEISRALRWAVAVGDTERAHRLLAATTWGWLVRGEMRTIQRHSEEVWALPGPPGSAPVEALNRTVRAMLAAAYSTSYRPDDELAALAALLPDLPEPRHPVVTLALPIYQAFGCDDQSAVVELAETASDPWLRGCAAQVLASLAENVGDVQRERRYLRVAHEGFREAGDRFGLGLSVYSLGEMEDAAGEVDAARALFLEAVALARELGNTEELPQSLLRLASLAVRHGEPGEVEEYVREAQRHWDHWTPVTMAFWNLALADVERRRGNLARARELVDGIQVDLLEDPGPGRPQREAYLLVTRAGVELDDGNRATARELLDQASEQAVQSADGPVMGTVAEASARCALAGGDPERAAELLGTATARRGLLRVGDPEVVAVRDAVRHALGGPAADEAMARGAALPRDHPLAP